MNRVMVAGLTVAALTAGSATTMGTRWMLVYAGGPHLPPYTVADFVHVIAAVDTAGQPTAWLGTGVIFLEIWAPSGPAFATYANHPWAEGPDWGQYLDTLFRAGGVVSRLDS